MPLSIQTQLTNKGFTKNINYFVTNTEPLTYK